MGKVYFFLLTLLVVVSLSACLPNNYGPDIISEKVDNSSGFSNDRVRHIFVDQPYLASGDYFLRAGIPGQHQKQVVAQHPPVQAKVDEPRAERGKVKEQQVDNVALVGPLKIKVGFLASPDLAGSREIDIFCKQAKRFFQNQVIFVPQLGIIEALGMRVQGVKKQGLQFPAVQEIASLSVYPGLRNLFFVNQLTVPDSFPGEATLALLVYDLGLGDLFKGPLFRSQVQDEQEMYKFWQMVLTQTWEQVWQKDQLMPWYAKMLYRQQELVVANAGQEAGLHQGQILEVLTPGKVVRSVSGVAVGWLPGKHKGKMQVQGFAGVGRALLKPLGQVDIKPEDLLVFTKK